MAATCGFTVHLSGTGTRNCSMPAKVKCQGGCKLPMCSKHLTKYECKCKKNVCVKCQKKCKSCDKLQCIECSKSVTCDNNKKCCIFCVECKKKSTSCYEVSSSSSSSLSSSSSSSSTTTTSVPVIIRTPKASKRKPTEPEPDTKKEETPNTKKKKEQEQPKSKSQPKQKKTQHVDEEYDDIPLVNLYKKSDKKEETKLKPLICWIEKTPIEFPYCFHCPEGLYKNRRVYTEAVKANRKCACGKIPGEDDLTILNTIEKLLVSRYFMYADEKMKCNRGGCDYTDTVTKMYEHRDGDCKRTQCKNDKCTDVVDFADLDSHMRVCKYRQVYCPYDQCDSRMTALELTDHLKDFKETHEGYANDSFHKVNQQIEAEIKLNKRNDILKSRVEYLERLLKSFRYQSYFFVEKNFVEVRDMEDLTKKLSEVGEWKNGDPCLKVDIYRDGTGLPSFIKTSARNQLIAMLSKGFSFIRNINCSSQSLNETWSIFKGYSKVDAHELDEKDHENLDVKQVSDMLISYSEKMSWPIMIIDKTKKFTDIIKDSLKSQEKCFVYSISESPHEEYVDLFQPPIITIQNVFCIYPTEYLLDLSNLY